MERLLEPNDWGMQAGTGLALQQAPGMEMTDFVTGVRVRGLSRAIGALCALSISLGAASATAAVVSYQKGDGKGVGSETDHTTVTEDTPTTNFSVDVLCGVDQTGTHDHCILKFPNIFGNGANQIPLGSTIVSATLTLYMTNDGADNGLSCPQVFQVTEPWTEAQATWNVRSTAVNWANPGADGTASHTETLRLEARSAQRNSS